MTVRLLDGLPIESAADYRGKFTPQAETLTDTRRPVLKSLGVA